MVSDMLQERHAQLGLRLRKLDIERNIETGWIDLEKKKMEDYDSKMRVKIEEEYHKKMKNAKDIE